jgi:branched-chain amino acid transport system permease protein
LAGFDFGFLAQLVANGAVTGGVYVLVALGLTLIFGVLGIVNFAHGEFYMLGGYLGLFAATALKFDFFAALALAMIAVAVVGVVAERLVFRPLRRSDPTGTIISSFGLAVVMQNVALLLFGAEPQMIRTAFGRAPVNVGEVFLTVQRALIPAFALAVVVVLHLVLRHTWAGRALRAAAQNPTVASLAGIDVERVAIGTFAVGTALAAAAGVLMGAVFLMQPGIGSMIALKGFTVVILGGMGNFYGAVGAGFLLGIAESLTAGYLTNEFKDIVAFLLVIAVLLVRPAGLFGRSLVKV